MVSGLWPGSIINGGLERFVEQWCSGENLGLPSEAALKEVCRISICSVPAL
jgi:hypothetical protein